MLKIERVSKVFFRGTVNERVAVDDLSLFLDKGDFVTVIGGNGAGKSTLINLVSGTYLPDKGRIMLDGRDVTYEQEHRRSRYIGHLFQDPLKGTAPTMTIEENLSLAYGTGFGPLRIGISKEARQVFREQLAQLDLGLEDRMKTKMGLLSGGQRQAVTLLMATISKPKLLLLDEHTSALDPDTAEKILTLTREIVERENITTIMITHNIQSALAYGNRTLMLSDGEIILDITGQERSEMTTNRIMELFKVKKGKEFANDRTLL